MKNVTSNLCLSLCTFIAGLMMISCGPDTSSNTPSSVKSNKRLSRMSSSEQQSLAPNQLFKHVINGNAEKSLKVANSKPKLLYSVNEKHGDTPLGTSLRFREKKIAEKLLSLMDSTKLLKGNKKNEGYLFLAAEVGAMKVLNKLVEKYKSQLSYWQNYDFGDLDFENKKGQRALHAAAFQRIAEWLKIQYRKGLLEVAWDDFILNEDINGQNFLHAAVLDARVDIISWGVEEVCKGTSLEDEGGNWLTKGTGYLLNRLRSGVQTYVGGFGAGFHQKFNHQDKNLETPLHHAAREQNPEAIYAIAHCKWVDYYLDNNDGQIPLQTFLANLPQNQNPIPKRLQEAFIFLTKQRTKMRTMTTNFTDYVNNQDKKGNSSLHLAAQLADPFYYNYLLKWGDRHLSNKKNQTPEDVFQQRQELAEKDREHL